MVHTHPVRISSCEGYTMCCFLLSRLLFYHFLLSSPHAYNMHFSSLLRMVSSRKHHFIASAWQKMMKYSGVLLCFSYESCWFSALFFNEKYSKEKCTEWISGRGVLVTWKVSSFLFIGAEPGLTLLKHLYLLYLLN